MKPKFNFPPTGRYSKQRVAEGEWGNMCPEERENWIVETMRGLDPHGQEYNHLRYVEADDDSLDIPPFMREYLVDGKDMREFLIEDLESADDDEVMEIEQAVHMQDGWILVRDRDGIYIGTVG